MILHVNQICLEQSNRIRVIDRQLRIKPHNSLHMYWLIEICQFISNIWNAYLSQHNWYVDKNISELKRLHHLYLQNHVLHARSGFQTSALAQAQEHKSNIVSFSHGTWSSDINKVISQMNSVLCTASLPWKYDLSLSLCVPLFILWEYVLMSVTVFPLHLFYNFLESFGLPAYFSNHNLFSREHIFVGLNKFPSLVQCHLSPVATGAFSFSKRWDFTCVQCDVCTDTGPTVLSPIRVD